MNSQNQTTTAETAFHKRYRRCVTAIQVLLLLGFGAVLVRAVQLQVWKHEFWSDQARMQNHVKAHVPVARGSIYDRRGRLLATSLKQYSLYAVRPAIEDPESIARVLGPIISEKPSRLVARITRHAGFTWLKRNLSDRQAQAVSRLHLKGIGLSADYQRFYPFRTLAGQVLGFVGVDGEGLEGVEKSYDAFLAQKTVSVGQFRDGGRRRLALGPEVSYRSAGSALRVSLDAYLQFLCERELARMAAEQHPRSAQAVILDPDTFEVLAMADWPFFDPNRYRCSTPERWRNRAITDQFEPGSTFKVFLLGAAFDRKVIGMSDRLFCENGRFRLAGHTIHDVHPHGWLTIPEVLKVSSNIGASKLALKVGAEPFYEYIRAFGFGRRTGIRLPGEVSGRVRPWSRWHDIDLAAVGFGQSIGVTALQLATAFAVIANDGVWKRPRIACDIYQDRSRSRRRRPIQPSHRVLRRSTARRLRAVMEKVTEEGGTGWRARLTGYRVAGKTGTAQLVEAGSRRYSEDKYTAIFAGMVPAQRPRLVIVVVVQEPQRSKFGGVVAGPVFRNVAQRALPYLGIQPVPGDSGKLPIRRAGYRGTNG